MGKPFTLYYTNFDRYERCPQQFLWYAGWGAIDNGGGPGRPKPKPLKKSEHHIVMGVVIQGVIEKFYNGFLWKLLPPAQLKDRMLEMCEQDFKLQLAKKYIDWRVAPPREELLKCVKDGVMGYMKTLKAQKFLGPYAQAEVDLVAYADKYCPIGGRADVIFTRDDVGTTILDGKNGARYKDGKGGYKTYTDPDQLRWYALCYYLCYHKMVDRLGFVYYRYPYGTPILKEDGTDSGEVEQGVVWVTYTKDDLKGLAQRALDARKAIDKEKFVATPEPKTCRFCDYESVCPERQTMRENNRRKPNCSADAKLDSITGLEVFTF
jgi:CRISPR/Cas system-associated exonuclease Cas4 (RecB family)